jgi:cytochrome oxidase Cu insertion factor (SCO1/SenC/PrrC family)
MEKQVIKSVVVDSNGYFEISYEQKETFEIYVETGRYKGILITEPGNEYNIKLPPYETVPEIESRSPYFKRKQYWLGLPDKTESELNFHVRSFIKAYNIKLKDNFAAIYKKASKDAVETIKLELNKEYPDSDNIFFNSIKLYCFAELELLVSKNMIDDVLNKYFSKSPILSNNPKYQEIFRSISENFLSKKAGSIKGNEIYSLIKQGQFTELATFFSKLGYNKNFAEMIVLKGLHDGYYSNFFPKGGITRALKEAKSKASTAESRLLAEKISKKITHLTSGKSAPPIVLTDANGEEVTLKSFGNKYIYLNFIYTDSRDCQYELNIIKNIQQRYHEVLEIVTISLDKDFDVSKNYWKNNNFTWKLLDGSKDKDIADSYSVKSTPSFYLISPEGTLLLSPAPSVSKGFDAAFVNVFRRHENKRKRK